MSYRVELPVFSGPMDLLLHLVKQQEVDIHDVRIATVLDQYLAHLDVLEALDLSDLGDFVVMASTLMEIKSRELLPREEIDLEQDLDPKDDLIQRLLEYKRYRDISRRLAAMMERRGQMLPPVLPAPPELPDTKPDEERTFDLGNIQIWDLTEAFARLLEETGSDRELHFDVARRTVDDFVAQILDHLRGATAREVDFVSLFDPSRGRYELIGVFTACLEMMKQGYLSAYQDDATRRIVVAFRGPRMDVTPDEILRGDRQGFDPLEDAAGAE
ncbi:MAG: segregation/condensation protein A [Planctomycetes bacterium]|nr:segregation/condensation protein A [Planctomycetota bacterium]